MPRLGPTLTLCAAVLLHGTAALLPHVHGHPAAGSYARRGAGGEPLSLDDWKEPVREPHGICLACAVHGPVVTTLAAGETPPVLLSVPKAPVLDTIRPALERQCPIHVRGPPIPV